MASKMSRYFRVIKRVKDDESGASMVEYAVLLVIAAIAGTVGVMALGTQLNSAFNGMASWVSTHVVAVITP